MRDLPPKDGSVRPDENFAMDWAADDRGQKQVAAIAKALKGADTLYLATDPDREGEAISWHVRAMLDEAKALRGVAVHRITFNEITRSAVRYAIDHPRELDQPLIEAYLARRALDYLVGFTLSPVLWRKLPGSRSAGRVQSVALRLICEREAEIEAFRAREYWTVEGHFQTPAGAPFTARLTHLDGNRLDQFDLNTEALAHAAKAAVEAAEFKVASVERRRVKRNPPAPFTTSTLQQEASRKLGMGAQQTMRCAQQLYEGVDLGGETVGLITYMRTDGVQMAREAVTSIREHVGSAYGDRYVPSTPREYASRAKNAQEAHEAVRPTDVSRTPDSVARFLDHDQRRLYELVWKRAVASQMQSAELDQVTVEIAGGRAKLRATGSIIAFDGFLKLYREDVDDAPDTAADDNRMLPPMHEQDPLHRGAVNASQHFTQPPPRYGEASLVKKMEELGIGRPSTYASILTVLRDRNYVRLDARRFIPEDRGRLVTAFLTSFFERYVDTGFTANLEEQLDDISGGRADWRAVMQAFWEEFSKAVEQTRELKISDVIDALDADLGEHFFPVPEDGGDPRLCPNCHKGRLGLRLGRHGSFIGCSNYPECKFTRALTVDAGDGDGETLQRGPAPARPAPADRGGRDRPARPLRALRPAGRARPGQQEGQGAPYLAAQGHGRQRDRARPGAGPAVAAAAGGHPPGPRRADRGRAGPVRAVRADGRGLRLAGPRRRCPGGGAEPGRRPAGQEAGQRAHAGRPPGRQGAGAGPQGTLRPVRAARPDGRQPAPRRGDGRVHPRRCRGPAEGARQGAETEGRQGWRCPQDGAAGCQDGGRQPGQAHRETGKGQA